MESDEQMFKTLLHVWFPNINGDSCNTIPFCQEFCQKYVLWIDESTKHLSQYYHEKKLQNAKYYTFLIHLQRSINSHMDIFNQILKSNKILSSMINDLEKTNFTFLNEKVNQVIGVDIDLISKYPKTLIRNLQELRSAESWFEFFSTIIYEFYSAYKDKDSTIIKSIMFSCISFYMNDLTLRNAESFGSFHILRTLFEEYSILWYYTKPTESEEKYIVNLVNDTPKDVTIIDTLPQEPPSKIQRLPIWLIGQEKDPKLNSVQVPFAVNYPPPPPGSEPNISPILSNNTVTTGVYYFPQDNNLQRTSPFEYSVEFDGRSSTGFLEEEEENEYDNQSKEE